MRRRLTRLAIGVFRKLCPHVRGRRIPRERDLCLAVPFGAKLVEARGDRRIAIVCHIFYPDLAEEMLACARAMPVPVDVFLSTDTAAKRDQIAQAFQGFDTGTVDIRIVPNRGRDIAPKVCAFRDVYDRHELVLLLHGKKTPDFGKGEAWRHMLLGTLAGSTEIISSILAIFELRPDVGMVICQHFEPIRPFIGWHHNFRTAKTSRREWGSH